MGVRRDCTCWGCGSKVLLYPVWVIIADKCEDKQKYDPWKLKRGLDCINAFIIYAADASLTTGRANPPNVSLELRP